MESLSILYNDIGIIIVYEIGEVLNDLVSFWIFYNCGWPLKI